MAAETPILPAHIEDTIAAIAKLHADHRQETGALQHLVDSLTAWIGRPQFTVGLTAAVVLWIVGNLLIIFLGVKPWDDAPFAWLQGILTLLALYVTVLILTTQRREDLLAGYREQLTLELAILNEQKSAKIIALLKKCVATVRPLEVELTTRRRPWLSQPIHKRCWTPSRKARSPHSLRSL